MPSPRDESDRCARLRSKAGLTRRARPGGRVNLRAIRRASDHGGRHQLWRHSASRALARPSSAPGRGVLPRLVRRDELAFGAALDEGVDGGRTSGKSCPQGDRADLSRDHVAEPARLTRHGLPHRRDLDAVSGSGGSFAAGAMTGSFAFFFALGYGAKRLKPIFAKASAWPRPIGFADKLPGEQWPVVPRGGRSSPG
jgi:hypothetical protein